MSQRKEMILDKIAYLRTELVITSNAEAKFELKKRIEELEKQLLVINDNPTTNIISTPKSYKLANINRLLMSFSDENINLMAMFHFEQVHQNFTNGQSKQERIMKLISHCKEFLKMETLLLAAEEQNTETFNQHKPYF